jgi:spoIIIJ-associated protein
VVMTAGRGDRAAGRAVGRAAEPVRMGAAATSADGNDRVAEAGMPEVERSAPSVEEAVDAALTELGVSEQEASIEVVQEPKGGFLGLAAQPAIVRVRTSGGEHPARPLDGDGDVEGSGTLLDDQADVAADFVEDLLELMGIDGSVEISEADGVTYVDVWGEGDDEGIGVLIGRHGATLDGLQDLVRSVVQRQTAERCQVLVDVEDYRKRRRSQVLKRARDAAAKARRSGTEVTLEPMNSYERKLVHDAVAAFGGLETASEGEEPSRRVVIRPTS